MLHRAPWSDHAYVEVVLLFGLYPAGLFVTISGTSINLASPQKKTLLLDSYCKRAETHMGKVWG